MGIRRDWYQSNETVILALLIKGTRDVTVDFGAQALSLSGTDKDGNSFSDVIKLAMGIDSSASSYKVTANKIELRLKKAVVGSRWEALEETESEPVPVPVQHNATKNWDLIGKEAEEEQNKDIEEGGGEAALQQMFKKIYAGATDETRRAMMKSFQESNGTVLSTNWNEVGQDKVEMKPPDSMEFKKWEG